MNGQLHTGFLVLSGNIEINSKNSAKEGDFVLLQNTNESFLISANETSEIFLLSGKPLNESIKVKGFFVMNTEEEIEQANQDLKNGLFGNDKF